MSKEPAVKRSCEAPTSVMIEYPDEEPAVRRFREFLSVRSVSVTSLDTPGPQPDYGGCGYMLTGVYICSVCVCVCVCRRCCEIPGA